MASNNPKKRRAPGSSPIQNQSTNAQQAYQNFMGFSDPSQLSNDQFMAWGQNAPAFGANGTSYGYNSDGMMAPPTQNIPSLKTSQSTELVRMNQNNALALQGRNDLGLGSEAWPTSENAVDTPPDSTTQGDNLDARAAAAKQDALSKRPPKQIPPFIQKLRSFLDQTRNTDLIRWSDDGNSFIVLDEERFANELVPEMFKHKNFSSFVRQLNMYGFHKRVGLADNSMRASETQKRSASEYFNPYFKRGRPELLWLIQKPKAEPKGVQKKGKLGKEEDDEGDGDVGEGGQLTQNRPMDLTAVSQASFANLQQEVTDLRRSQQQIHGILTRLRDDNNQYIRQAQAMVAQHERHENSINAILTFLATFYNRSLEGNGNLANMFASAMPNSQPGGHVVDVDDFEGLNQAQSPLQIPRQNRQPLALLPAPQSDSAATTPIPISSRHQTQTPNHPPSDRLKPPGRAQGHVVELPSHSPRSSVSASSPANNDEMMSMIHNVNAHQQQQQPKSISADSPNFDFDTALKHYQHADGNAPLTAEQRNTMLSIMANNSGTTTPAAFGNNLGNQQQNPYNEPLSYFTNKQDQLDMLARLQDEQNNKMQDLADRLQPLSPGGSIPGLEGITPSRNPSLSGGFSPTAGLGMGHNFYGNGTSGNSSDFDINAFINDYPTNDDEQAQEHIQDQNQNKNQQQENQLRGGAASENDYFNVDSTGYNSNGINFNPTEYHGLTQNPMPLPDDHDEDSNDSTPDEDADADDTSLFDSTPLPTLHPQPSFTFEFGAPTSDTGQPFDFNANHNNLGVEDSNTHGRVIGSVTTSSAGGTPRAVSAEPEGPGRGKEGSRTPEDGSARKRARVSR